jgi:hypothetical protein
LLVPTKYILCNAHSPEDGSSEAFAVVEGLVAVEAPTLDPLTSVHRSCKSIVVAEEVFSPFVAVIVPPLVFFKGVADADDGESTTR